MITVSYSEIKKWRFCRQSHYYNYVEGIVPRLKSRPLKLGNIIHESIRSWAQNNEWETILSAVTKEYNRMFEEQQELYGNIPEIIKKIMLGYVSRYSKERKHYSLIEKTLGPIPLTKKTGFKLRIDRLMTTPYGLALCETKTGKKIPDEDLRIWDLQTILYVWALIKLGYPIKAIVWDYIRTKTPTEPQLLKNGTLSKRSDIDTDYTTYYNAIKANCPGTVKNYSEILNKLKGGSQNKFYKRIVLPITNSMIKPVLHDARITSLEINSFKNIPVRNISGFTCPRCFYSSLCHASLRGLDDSFIRKKEFMKKEEETNYGEEVEEIED